MKTKVKMKGSRLTALDARILQSILRAFRECDRCERVGKDRGSDN